jgi:capsular polysaccharide biosynthesis protein
MKEEPEQNNRSWFNLPNILIAITLLLILVILVWNQSISDKIFMEEESVPLMATLTPTVTANPAIPSEFFSTPANTSGIIVAAVILLAIIFSSALWKMRSVKK